MRFRRVYRLWYGRQRRFCRKLGAQLDGTRIKANADGSTAVPGLFAAGDCTGGLLQVAKAVADGAEAAMSAVKFVRK
ncbi:MAG: FAD-dependent oxidoreductase [Butyricicoccus sp.]